jgi:protein O-mannosyl-transferase
MEKRSIRKKARGKHSSKSVGKVRLAPPLPSWFTGDWFFGLILFFAVILIYQPVWFAGYIWDDTWHVTANPCVVGPLGLKDIWGTAEYRPFGLVIAAFWVEHALWGLIPMPYHLVNVLEQATCALVLWRVLRVLQVPGAWLGAALWALHPLQVESVAWISEMKNTQSGLFYLLAIFFFVRWLKMGETRQMMDRDYLFALLCAALAMASKSSTLILPGVLALCAWWVRGKWNWRDLKPLVPIFLMSVVAALITIWPVALDERAIVDTQWARSWPQRVATSGDVIWFYLGKLIWPHPLIFIYPRWQVDAENGASYLPLLAVIAVVSILWLKRNSGLRPWFFAMAYFLVALAPFLGLIDQTFWRYSFVEDHLQYLASMGPLALVGAGIVRLADSIASMKSWLQPSLCGGLLLILGTLSWQRTWAFENEEALWADTLAKNPNCWMAYNDLGHDLFQEGQTEEAITQYQKALEIYPNYGDAHSNLGSALLRKGRVDEAMAEYKAALKINPNYVEAGNNLGNFYLSKGQLDQAMTQFQSVLQKHPNSAEAHNNLAVALVRKGQLRDGIAQLQEALRLNPNYTDAQNNLAKVQEMIREAPDTK